MQLSDAAKKILLGHWWILIIFIAVGLGVALALHRADRPEYVATARLVLDTKDPQAVSEATSIADSARAIVTSPSHVSAALARVGVSRNADTVATENVNVQSLGSSNVVQLTVRDRDPRVAAGLANALADDLIQTRLAVDTGELGAQVKDVQSKIDQLDKQIAQLLNQTSAGGSVGQAASAQLTSLQNERSSLAQEKQGLIGLRDSRPNPMIIDPAVPASHPEPSRLPLDLALGALLGLVAGLGVAALHELLQPAISGQAALGRAADAPVLGHLSAGAEAATYAECLPVAGQLRLAAASSGATSVVLVPVGPFVQLAKLAWQLGRQASDGGEGNGISVYAEAPKRGASPWSTRIVLVLPTRLRLVDFAPLQDLIARTRWEVLGLITYSTPQPSNGSAKWWPGRHRRDTQPLAPVRESPVRKLNGTPPESGTAVGE